MGWFAYKCAVPIKANDSTILPHIIGAFKFWGAFLTEIIEGVIETFEVGAMETFREEFGCIFVGGQEMDSFVECLKKIRLERGFHGKADFFPNSFNDWK